MISTVLRHVARKRRRVARGPLTSLLRSCAAHAMAPYAGQRVTGALMVECRLAVERGVGQLAAAGALAYFGIRDAAELGLAPVSLYLVSDGSPPFGRVDLAPEALVSWIFSGGARGQGWRDPRALAAADLLRDR